MQLEAEALAAEQELEALVDARAELLAELLALSSAEASMLEVVHGLHFLKRQQCVQLELRVHRELLLLELARLLSCRVDQLPWPSAPVAG